MVVGVFVGEMDAPEAWDREGLEKKRMRDRTMPLGAERQMGEGCACEEKTGGRAKRCEQRR